MEKNTLVRTTIDNMSSLAYRQDMFPAHRSNSRREREPMSSPGSPPFSFCAHPIHLHSLMGLVNLSTIFKSRFQICFVCQDRISLVAAKEIVTCVACGVFSHRSCLIPLVVVAEEEEHGYHSFKRKNKENQGNEDKDDHNYTNRHGRVVEKCKVNLELLKDRRIFLHLCTTSTGATSASASATSSSNGNTLKSHFSADCANNVVRGDGDNWQHDVRVTNNAAYSHQKHNCDGNHLDNSHDKDLTNHDEHPSDTVTAQEQQQQQQQQQQHEWKQSLVQLSRLLHINNIFSSQGRYGESNNKISDISSPKRGQDSGHENNVDASIAIPDSGNSRIYDSHTLEQQTNAATMENSKIVVQRISQNLQSKMYDGIQTSDGNVNTEEDISTTILETCQVSMNDDVTREGNFIKGTWQMLQKTNNTRKSLGVASIAGSLAGATAGLIVAGPAGAYVGSKIGQVVGVAGVLIEGTLGVGALVAGVTGTVLTVKQLQNEGKRLLTIGGNGSEQVVLVRPNVTVDPIWNDITKRARRSAPKDSGLMEGFAFFGDKVAEANKKEREKRDREIAFSQEDEINTKEKVFLLVANSLNDKRGLPGYVYRELIGEVKKRVESRKQHVRNKMYPKGNEGSQLQELTRETRQDVHGIIKHITATLLEVRPGFCSSPRITELSAMAVETLVFGEIYDYVFEEICVETRQQDKNLEEKFSSLTVESKIRGINLKTQISHEAIIAIKRLPLYHSVGDKLRCCVELLEFISQSGTAQNMGADFLLTFVCQHLAVASVPHLNAECAFLEEFAKDEQLLQGKEGYALVTIQASIHFLNASEDIIQDVFLVQD